jgi:hypothetical protein
VPTQLNEKKSNIKMNSTNKGVKVEQIKLNESKAKNQRLREQIN